MIDEELLRLLENSDDDFGLSSGTDLGEGDSGDDDFDPEWSLPILQTNNTVQQEEENISDVPISSSGYTWSNRSPIVTHIPFSKSKGLKVFPRGNDPIDYFNLLFDDRLFELIVNETNKYAVQVFFIWIWSIISNSYVERYKYTRNETFYWFTFSHWNYKSQSFGRLLEDK